MGNDWKKNVGKRGKHEETRGNMAKLKTCLSSAPSCESFPFFLFQCQIFLARIELGRRESSREPPEPPGCYHWKWCFAVNGSGRGEGLPGTNMKRMRRLKNWERTIRACSVQLRSYILLVFRTSNCRVFLFATSRILISATSGVVSK